MSKIIELYLSVKEKIMNEAVKIDVKMSLTAEKLFNDPSSTKKYNLSMFKILTTI